MLLNLHTFKKFWKRCKLQDEYIGGVLNAYIRNRIYLTNTVYIEHRFYYNYICFIIVLLIDFRTICFFILKLMSECQLKVMASCVVFNLTNRYDHNRYPKYTLLSSFFC